MDIATKQLRVNIYISVYYPFIIKYRAEVPNQQAETESQNWLRSVEETNRLWQAEANNRKTVKQTKKKCIQNYDF